MAATACVLPLLLQLPSQVSLPIAIAGLATVGLSWRRPMPGWLRAVLTLAVLGAVLGLAGFRIGRDTGSALLAAMLAIKPAETVRLRDGRSLVGFALFAPFATFLLDQGPLSLVLGLTAALLALMALQRFAELESGDARMPVGAAARLRSVGQMLLIGLPLALAAFWLFPRLGTPLWGVPDRALARPGLAGTMRPGDWLDLLNDDTPVLRVRFFGEVPPPERMYWRGPVLTNFDGQEWTTSYWSRALPPAEVDPSAVRWDYELEVEPTDRRELVALDLPIGAPEGSLPQGDRSLRVPRPLSSLTRWRMRSAPPARFEPGLKHTLRQSALALPAGLNPRTLALARQWRAETTDDAAIVRRALDWVNREFAYTLDTPPWGRDGIDEFLFDTQAGYCEHFSASFVVLMRGAGIPARVVTGYTGGYRNPIGDYWVVRRSDAHAWAEAWLPQRGWVRVDPTAAVAPERIYDTLADRAPGVGGLFGGYDTPLWNMGDWMRRGWNDLVLGFDATRQQRMLRSLGVERIGGPGLILLFAVAAVLALGWMVWLSARGPRERDPLLRAWHRLGVRYRRLGLAREPHETPREWARRVDASRPDLATGLGELSRRFANWRYAPQEPGAGAERELRDLIRALRAHRPGPAATGPRAGGRQRTIFPGERQ